MSGVVKPSFFVKDDLVEYEWTVGVFKELHQKTGEHITSPSFEVLYSKTKWRLRVYPNGRNEESTGYVSACVCNESGAPVTLKYSLAIMGGDGNLYYKFSQHRQLFASVDSMWGHSKMASRTELLENSFTLLPWGKLIMYVSLQTIHGPMMAIESYKMLNTQFAYTWTVKLFAKLSLPHGKSIYSRAFTDPGQNATWCLQLYPEGKHPERTGKVSIGLVLLSLKKVKVKLTISLIDAKGGEKHGKTVDSQLFTEHDNNVTYGFAEFISRSKLFEEKATLMPHDDLLIQCTVTYLHYTTDKSFPTIATPTATPTTTNNIESIALSDTHITIVNIEKKTPSRSSKKKTCRQAGHHPSSPRKS